LAVERVFGGRSTGGIFEIREKRDEIRNKRERRRRGMLPPNFAQLAMAFYCHRARAIRRCWRVLSGRARGRS
jgi:hypothetical protein